MARLKRKAKGVGRQNDPRFEDVPDYVRDPGNYQENNDAGQTNDVPFDPQAIVKQPRYEMTPDNYLQRKAIRDGAKSIAAGKKRKRYPLAMGVR